jgi:hypothetical protein
VHVDISYAFSINCIIRTSVWNERCLSRVTRVGLKPGSETYGYKAFSGEGFVMQCTKPQSAGLCERLYNITASSEEADWSKAEGETNRDRDDGAVTGRGNALWFSTVTAKDSGKYTCHTG